MLSSIPIKHSIDWVHFSHNKENWSEEYPSDIIEQRKGRFSLGRIG
jgi:hypothetical protein